MKTKKILFLSIVILNLNACASMNKSECLNADWKIIGMEDGADGRLPSYIGEHRTACAGYNIKPNLDTYMQGHNIGILQYCTAQNGFNVGQQGKTYNGVCPQELEIQFLGAYEHGYEYYTLNSELDNIDYSIESKHHDIIDVKHEISNAEQKIISNDTTENQRVNLLEIIKEHQHTVTHMEAEIQEYLEQKLTVDKKLELLDRKYNY